MSFGGRPGFHKKNIDVQVGGRGGPGINPLGGIGNIIENRRKVLSLEVLAWQPTGVGRAPDSAGRPIAIERNQAKGRAIKNGLKMAPK